VKRTPLKNDVASTSRSPSTDTTEANLIKQNTVRRRSFLQGLGMAGVAALPASVLLINQAKAREDTDENDDNGGRLSTGDASILRFLAAVITLVTLQVTTAFAAQTYLITDLGTLPGATTASAAAINNSNQVVGSSGLDAFLLSNGTMRDLGNFGGSSFAAALNSAGDVVGSASTSSGTHPFLVQNGKLSDLGIPSGFNSGVATGVNSSDQVVGQFNGGSRRQAFSRAFLWQNGKFTDLGTLGGRSASARGINKWVQIVGSSLNASGQNHAFVWQNGIMSDLGTLPGGAFSSAAAINDAGAIAGSSDDGNFVSHAVIFQNGVITDLGVPSDFTSSSANALNLNGVVVGAVATGSYRGVSHAFVAQNGSIADLNRLIPGNSGPWVLLTATGVNDAGEIVGTATFNGTERAFLLTPTTQPTVPAVPIHLAASSGNSVVALSWEGSVGAAGYNVKRSNSSSGPFSTIASVNTTNFTDHAVTNCSLYYYVASALNSAGESPNSSSATGVPQSVPAAPSNMTASPDHNPTLQLGSAIDLAWQNNAGTCSEGNVIERSTDGVNFQTLATYPPNQNTGTDAFLNSGTRYYYRVRAQSNGGESGPSNVASAVAP
jgi:probable HAF family extracellular repeat protein